MNDGMYTNIRNYLEEIASKQGQIIAGQTRTNELLNEIRLGVNRTDGRAKEIAAQVAEREGVNPSDVAVALGDDNLSVVANKRKDSPLTGPVTVETVKEEPLKTTETVEVKDSPPATSKSKKKPTKPDNKPAVNWNS